MACWVFRRPVLIQAFHAQTPQGGFAMAGHEDDFAVAAVEVLQAVYGDLDGGAVLRDQTGQRIRSAVVADGCKPPNGVGNQEKFSGYQSVLSGGMAGQGDGNQVGTDAVALFKRIKRFVKADFGQVFDKAGALWQVLGQQFAQEALFDFDNAVGQAFGFVGTVNKVIGGAGKDDFCIREVFESGNMVGVQVGQEDLVDVVCGIAQTLAYGRLAEGDGCGQCVKLFGKTAAGFKKAGRVAGIEKQVAALVGDMGGHRGKGNFAQAAAPFDHTFGMGAVAGVVETDVHSFNLSRNGRIAAVRRQR